MRALPTLTALAKACAEGRYEEQREALERYLADHPDDKPAAFLLRFLAAVARDPSAAREALEADGAAAEEEIALLSAKQEQQAALLDKLAYVNEALERQQRELLASRWRKLGLRLGLAKRASFER